MLTFIPLFLQLSLFADSSIFEGIYSSAPVVGDNVIFELKEKGKLVVTPNKSLPKKTIEGSWSYQEPNLVFTYSSFKDEFMTEDCPRIGPCLKFVKHLGKSGSPLAMPYGFGKHSELKNDPL